MAKGDEANPWSFAAADYQGKVLSVVLPWDSGTRNILAGTAVHRDPGCQYHTIVFDNPSNVLLRKPLPSMTDAQTDATLTAVQVRNATGFRTIDDLYAAGQVTAEP